MRDILYPIAIGILCAAAYGAARFVWAMRREVKELRGRVEKLERRLQDVEHGR